MYKKEIRSLITNKLNLYLPKQYWSLKYLVPSVYPKLLTEAVNSALTKADTMIF